MAKMLDMLKQFLRVVVTRWLTWKCKTPPKTDLSTVPTDVNSNPKPLLENEKERNESQSESCVGLGCYQTNLPSAKDYLMTDHEMLLHVNSELVAIIPRLMALNDAVNQHLRTSTTPPVEPPVGPTPPPTGDLGWSNGNPVLASNASQTYSITPSADWLSLAATNAAQVASGGIPRGYPVATLSLSGGYNPAAGVTPPFVAYTIGGVTQEFNGSMQNWSYNPTFPNGFPRPTGPFTVTVTLRDDNHQPVGAPYGVAVQLNHTP